MICPTIRPRLFASALAGLASPAIAEEAVRLTPVQVTAARVPEPAFAVPQPIAVLDADEIAKKTPQVMAELLRGQPGVFFQQTGAGQGMAIVRGLKGAEVLHLVDGFRLNNAFFRTAPSQYIALIDPYNIAQLEVLRGPYATLYGSDAMGGVVQITTPEERFSDAKPNWRTKFLGHYATADLAKVGRVSHAVGNKTTGSYERGDQFDRRINLMADWAKFLSTANAPSRNVIALRGTA